MRREIKLNVSDNRARANTPEVENFIRQRTLKSLTADLNPSLSRKKIVATFLSSRFFEYLIIGLIMVYSIIVFITFGVDENDDNQDIKRMFSAFLIMQLVFLIIFCLEIVANIYAYGFQFYFKDRWLFFDAIVIVGSIILLVLDFYLDSDRFSSISKILRGIFRFLRIFLLFRKVNQFKRIKPTYSKYDIKTPVEKILEILGSLKELYKNQGNLKDMKEIEWCIEIISSNKLYEPILENFNQNSNAPDMLNWISNYSDQKGNKENSKKDDVEAKDLDIISKRGSIIGYDAFEKKQKSSEESTIPREVDVFLEHVDEFEFDIFKYQEITNGLGLVHLLNYFFSSNDLFDSLGINVFCLNNFSKRVQTGYRKDNPYHNDTHACDITQTANFFLKKCKWREIAALTNVELASIYIAAAVHDYDHPGTNNIFQISTKAPLALRYNDKSVLEMHHASSAFFIMQEDQNNIFGHFSKEDFNKARERIVSMVLATDMTLHFVDIAKVKGRLQTSDFNIAEKDKNMTMDIMIHACDISNPMKPWNICKKWTDLILKEYWAQGDQERRYGVPISYLMDRYTTNTAKSQIGFIDVIVQPLFEVIKCFLPILDKYNGTLELNKEQWKTMIKDYDEELRVLEEEKAKEEI